MYKYILIIQVILASIFISGCTQKVTIKALEPAEIDRASSMKRVAVLKFDNDIVGLSAKIESNLAKYTIENEPFFTVLNRNDIDKIIDELNLQYSGLVDTSTAVEAGNLVGAQAIISGVVKNVSSRDSYFYEERSKCIDKKCKETFKYKVSCKKRVIELSADIRMIDIQSSEIIYVENMFESSEYERCSDESSEIPSTLSEAINLANFMANKFTYKLTPHYHYFSVELLEDADLNYDEYQELLLENSLEYIKQNHHKKAENLLNQLIDSTNQKSYVPYYNLGVIKESQGKYFKAKEYYIKADSLTIKPVDVISSAYLRIDSIIYKCQKTKEQISR